MGSGFQPTRLDLIETDSHIRCHELLSEVSGSVLS